MKKEKTYVHLKFQMFKNRSQICFKFRSFFYFERTKIEKFQI